MKVREELPEIIPKKKDRSGNNQDRKPVSVTHEQS